MKKLKGSHTSLTPLSQDIFDILTRSNPEHKIQISPGYITQKNIKVKQVSIKLKDETTSVLCEVLMKGSKQSLRIYGATVPEVSKLLKKFSESKQILIKTV